MKPEGNENLGHPPPNEFLPDPNNLVNLKKKRVDPKKSEIPVKLTIPNSPHELWFKQDDYYE